MNEHILPMYQDDRFAACKVTYRWMYDLGDKLDFPDVFMDVFGVIFAFVKDGSHECYASVMYIANTIRTSETTVKRATKALEEIGLISKDYHENKRVIYSIVEERLKQLVGFTSNEFYTFTKDNKNKQDLITAYQNCYSVIDRSGPCETEKIDENDTAKSAAAVLVKCRGGLLYNKENNITNTTDNKLSSNKLESNSIIRAESELPAGQIPIDFCFTEENKSITKTDETFTENEITSDLLEEPQQAVLNHNATSSTSHAKPITLDISTNAAMQAFTSLQAGKKPKKVRKPVKNKFTDLLDVALQYNFTEEQINSYVKRHIQFLCKCRAQTGPEQFKTNLDIFFGELKQFVQPSLWDEAIKFAFDNSFAMSSSLIKLDYKYKKPQSKMEKIIGFQNTDFKIVNGQVTGNGKQEAVRDENGKVILF